MLPGGLIFGGSMPKFEKKIVKVDSEDQPNPIENFPRPLQGETGSVFKDDPKENDEENKVVLVKVKPNRLIYERTGAHQGGAVFRTTLGRAKKLAADVDIIQEGDQIDL